MLTDAILRGINKAWGAREEEEETWEQTRDRIWANAKSTPGLGRQFWAMVGLDPDMNTEDLTEEDVKRLSAELSRLKVDVLKQRTLDRTFEEEKRLAEEDLPWVRRAWKKGWGVPESEWEGWGDYPMEVEQPASVGSYYGAKEGSPYISLSTAHAYRPDIIGHELSHANYFENMPPLLRAIYPWAHKLAQQIDPEYREAVESYGRNIAGTDVSKGTLPMEGYATAYQKLGQQPEQMPWYQEPFYGNLMYPVPEGKDTTLRWLVNWAVDKVKKWQKEKDSGTTGSQTTASTLPRAASPNKPAVSKWQGGTGGGSGHHGEHLQLL